MKFPVDIVKRGARTMLTAVVVALAAGATGQSLNQKPAETKKLNVAVMTLKNASGITEGESALISDRLRGELFNTGKANVMERDQMQEILKEQGFQQSGTCTDEACLVQMGQMLGVEALVSGSIGKLGSMYLVNLRVIDVKTGKITAVVSRDIKGGLEEVVDYLKGVAMDLVTGASGNRVAPAATPVSSAEPAKKEEPKETVETSVSETPKAEEPKPAPAAAAEAGSNDPNKNRSGLRISFGVHPGAPTYFLDDSLSEPEMAGNGWTAEYGANPMARLDLTFMIKAGPFLDIDIGPSLQWQRQDYIWTLPGAVTEIDSIGIFLGAVGLRPGINFVKRWHPFKLNVGVFADLCYSWWSSTYSVTSVDQYGYSTSLAVDDTMATNFGTAFLFGPGVKVGGEFLLGNHFGLSVDFLFRYSSPSYSFSSMSDLFLGGSATDDAHARWLLGYYLNEHPDQPHPTVTVRWPMFGVDAGVNIYF
jgi:curli biogenesis system outer membrane secretion channel CsgG